METSEAALIRCPKCGATNQVPREKSAQGLEPVCGWRQTPLSVTQRKIFFLSLLSPLARIKR